MNFLAFSDRESIILSYEGCDAEQGILGKIETQRQPLATADSREKISQLAKDHLARHPAATIYITDEHHRLLEIVLDQNHHQREALQQKWHFMAWALLVICIISFVGGILSGQPWVGLAAFVLTAAMYLGCVQLGLFNEVEAAFICVVNAVLILLLAGAIAAAVKARQSASNQKSNLTPCWQIRDNPTHDFIWGRFVMFDTLRFWLDRFSYRLAPVTSLPKADVRGSLLNAASLGLQPKLLLDIGANEGKWTRFARHVFPQCSFLMIEPQQEMQRYLDPYCLPGKNCEWLCCGVGDHVGEATFTVNPNTVGSSFNTTAEKAAAQNWERRTVPLVTIDHLIETKLHRVPEIVKIDAEGYEMKILSGADKLWGQCELIFVEVSFLSDVPGTNSFVEIVKFFDSVDYVPFDFSWFGKKDKLVNSIGEVAFVPRGGFLRKRFEKKAAAKLAAA